MLVVQLFHERTNRVVLSRSPSPIRPPLPGRVCFICRGKCSLIGELIIIIIIILFIERFFWRCQLKALYINKYTVKHHTEGT